MIIDESVRETPQALSWLQRLYFSILIFSMRFIIISFIVVSWHFAWWLGVLFALAVWASYGILSGSALEDFKQRPDEYE